MAKYLEIIGKYYNDSQVYHIGGGDTLTYNDINWITTPIPQGDLDIVRLIDYKTDQILEFSLLAQEDIIHGFESSALGTPHFYSSEPEDQLNMIGAAATGEDVVYACYPAQRAEQEVNLGGNAVGSLATGLANNTTVYTAEIIIDGESTYVSIVGNDAQTYTDLINEIQADIDLVVTGALVELKDGNICICSGAYISASTVSILDTNLFNSLTHYDVIDVATAGLDAANATVKAYLIHTNTQMRTMLVDGKDVKLAALQKFNVKKGQIIAAVDIAAVDLITW